MIPSEVKKLKEGAGLKISWPDQVEKEFSALLLRQNCHCAACRHELTGEQLLDIKSLPPHMTLIKVELMGNYALGLHFSDGHSTGIYTFHSLRNLLN
ncbi:MAG: DUF971 domain-containing protein [Elusimicrobiota bacterium]